MPHYKTLDNKVHFLDGAAFEYVLPTGCIQITDIQANEILNPPKPLTTLKTEKIAQIDAAYNAAIQQDISYMGTTFQADEDSQSILTKTLVTLNGAGSAPADWAWKDANNNMVPMTLAETNGLAMAMLARGWPEFQLRDARKKAVAAATTDAEVAAVTW